VLGPLAETELRRALAVSAGDPAVLVASPFTITLYTILVIITVVSIVQHLRKRRSAGSGPDRSADDTVSSHTETTARR
jgi:putative tricarboxylic transport membrane protein